MVKIDTADEIQKLLAVLPLRIKKFFEKSSDVPRLIEIILDLGKPPEGRFMDGKIVYMKDMVDKEDIKFVTDKVGVFTSDNRSGIERTLHRISAIRNRMGKVIGLTCRMGRAILGTIDIIRDVIESGKNTLFLGDEFKKRVVVVDTSNEIAGDGDIPHPGIGRSRRMQVQSPDRQHAVMIEAVENHMPEVVIVDEIGTEAEAIAARTIAERGVQLIGTAHGNTLENIISNPTLSDLVGGIQSVILGDEEAKRRQTQKAVLERKAPPTFDIAIEIREKDTFAIYHDVAKAVDSILRNKPIKPEIRIRTKQGVKIEKPKEEMPEISTEEAERALEEKEKKVLRIFPYGINRGFLERGLRVLQVPALAVKTLDDADLVLTVKSKARPGSRIILSAESHNIPVHVIRKNVSSQIMKFLKFYFGINKEESEEAAILEAKEANRKVIETGKSIDLNPQNAYIRRIQHQEVQNAGLRSESVGEEPKRRLRIYPPSPK
jgi:stage III sporulation protein SpoIIIAA